MLKPTTIAGGASAAGRSVQRAPDARTVYLASPYPLRVTSTGEALVVRDHEAQVSRHWCAAGDPIALEQDLTALIWAEMNLNAGPLAAAISQPRDAAGIFERWSGTCAGAIHEHVASLRAHALSELTTGGGEPCA